MRLLFWILLVSVPLTAIACPSQSDLRLRAAAEATLVRASGLPAAEISQLLADCGASQQSMYFCAWRDQLEADHRLEDALATKISGSPQCKEALENQFAKWQHKRAQQCRADAAAQNDGGSLQRTAELICVRAATEAVLSRLSRTATCSFLN